MPRIKYANKRFGDETAPVVLKAREIIAEYRAQGYDLTLRQLYYQFVARDLIPNRDSEYKRLGDIVNRARMAGLIDWHSIVDRTRFVRDASHWDSPAELVRAASRQYRVDRWATQKVRPEVWIEKDALVGVIAGVCNRLDVPFFSCRGYVSQSEMWNASERILQRIRGPERWRPSDDLHNALVQQNYRRRGGRRQGTVIFHLGDHDPSGIDMSRDIQDRLRLFCGTEYEGFEKMFAVIRIALNYGQVEEYEPPPNPAKVTDSRARDYIRNYGDESWELDALEPDVLVALIEDSVSQVRDDDAYEAQLALEREGIARLEAVAEDLEQMGAKKSAKRRSAKKKPSKKKTPRKASKKKASKKKSPKKKGTKK